MQLVGACTTGVCGQSNGAIAAGDEPRAWKGPGESVIGETTFRGRLQHQLWRGQRHVRDDRLAKAAVMWKFGDMAGKIDLATARATDKTRGRLRLDVA